MANLLLLDNLENQCEDENGSKEQNEECAHISDRLDYHVNQTSSMLENPELINSSNGHC